MDDSDGRTRLLDLLRERALFRESVVLASGERTSHYFDAGQVLLDPEGAAIAGRLAHALLAPQGPEAVGGPTATAGSLVCAISAAAWVDGARWNGFFIRGDAKRYGLQNWIEGPFIEEGTPVAVVDDTLSTGATLIAAIERARSAGGVVVAALAVIDREEGGRAAVEESLDGAPIHTLFTASGIRRE